MVWGEGGLGCVLTTSSNQVFAYMHLSDLYNLARTCRRFRAFFLHPSNKRLWVAARKNSDDLPPCPPFMSEPAFAHLLFSTHCQVGCNSLLLLSICKFRKSKYAYRDNHLLLY